MRQRNTYDSPKNWEELVKLKPKIGFSDPNCNRLPDDQMFYEFYNELVPKEIRLEIINRMIGNNDRKIIKNVFDYLKLTQYLPKVKHYCLWNRTGELSPETIESEIAKKFPGKEYVWLENSPGTKSVPEIWHCQIFIKEK